MKLIKSIHEIGIGSILFWQHRDRSRRKSEHVEIWCITERLDDYFSEDNGELRYNAINLFDDYDEEGTTINIDDNICISEEDFTNPIIHSGGQNYAWYLL